MQRLLADHVAGVAGGIVHRAHAGALLGGGVLQQRAEDLHGDIARQQVGENVDLVGLVLIGRAAVGFALRSNTGGMICCAVGICAMTDLKREKNSVQTSNLPSVEQRDDLFGDRLRVLEMHRPHAAQFDSFDDLFAELPPQLIVALATDAEELDLFAFSGQRQRALARQPHDGGVERTAQPALGRTYDQKMHLIAAAAGEQLRRRAQISHRSGDVAEHLAHMFRIGPRRFRHRLRAAQLGRRHHLHRFGDLLRRLGGGDAVAQVFEARHRN